MSYAALTPQQPPHVVLVLRGHVPKPLQAAWQGEAHNTPWLPGWQHAALTLHPYLCCIPAAAAAAGVCAHAAAAAAGGCAVVVFAFR